MSKTFPSVIQGLFPASPEPSATPYPVCGVTAAAGEAAPPPCFAGESSVLGPRTGSYERHEPIKGSSSMGIAAIAPTIIITAQTHASVLALIVAIGFSTALPTHLF